MASSVTHLLFTTPAAVCRKISSSVFWAISTSVRFASASIPFSVSLFRGRSSFSSLTIDKHKNKRLFASARTYFPSKFKSPNISNETTFDNHLLLPLSEMEDTFDGMKVKWSVGSRSEKYKKWGLFPSHREIPFFELSFREDYEGRVRSEYLPYVTEEAARINGAKKLKMREQIQMLGTAVGSANLITSLVIQFAG